MRAIAILSMIEVHAAATFQPSNVSIQHPFAIIAAMIGGIAAPLFVTISGWGTYRSMQHRTSDQNGLSYRWIVTRVTALIFFQWIVNIISPNLFEWYSPGILSLLAICTAFSLYLFRFSVQIRIFILGIVCFSPYLLDYYFITNLSWSERIYSNDLTTWISRIFVTGTYPVFPWITFFILGSLINDINQKLRKIFGILLFSFSISFLIFSLVTNTTWALTSGSAVLTFFPVSVPFLITSMACVLIIYELLLLYNNNKKSTGRDSGFIHMGKLSLTIYVLHFIPFSLYNVSGIEYNFSIYSSFIIIIFYTLIWWFFAILHLKYCKHISLERLLKRISN